MVVTSPSQSGVPPSPPPFRLRKLPQPQVAKPDAPLSPPISGSRNDALPSACSRDSEPPSSASGLAGGSARESDGLTPGCTPPPETPENA